VASGRFGVTSYYLASKGTANQDGSGRQAGEGGELPGRKVYPWIAKVRHSTPGWADLATPPLSILSKIWRS